MDAKLRQNARYAIELCEVDSLSINPSLSNAKYNRVSDRFVEMASYICDELFDTTEKKCLLTDSHILY